MNHITYPYIPQGKALFCVPISNEFMNCARDIAFNRSLDKVMPTGSVVVKDGKIIGVDANGSDYHLKNECQRVKQGIATGQGYELCEGCHPKNHSEVRAIADALSRTVDIHGSDLYLWGHWWCCESCWNTILAGGIKHVYLLEKSEILFNKKHPDNIVGKQFIDLQ